MFYHILFKRGLTCARQQSFQAARGSSMRRRSTRMQSSSNIGSDGEAELDYDDDADKTSTESGQWLLILNSYMVVDLLIPIPIPLPYMYPSHITWQRPKMRVWRHRRLPGRCRVSWRSCRRIISFLLDSPRCSYRRLTSSLMVGVVLVLNFRTIVYLYLLYLMPMNSHCS